MPYWRMTPSGPMPGAVGREVWGADLKPYEPTAEELAQQSERDIERERRRIIRAEADLAEQKRKDDWREFERLRQQVAPRRFQPRVRASQTKIPIRQFKVTIRKHGSHR